jgi:predicted phosphodiesterase
MINTIKIPKGQEIVVVGDIHENEYHIDKMVEQAEVGTKRILVSLGDVYNKGEGNHVADRIVNKIRSLHNNGWAYMIRGNHEQRAIKKAGNKLSSELGWCKTLPMILSFLFSNNTRITIVHGGVAPYHTWKNVSSNTEIMYIRTLDDSGNPIPLVWTEENGIKKLIPKSRGILWHELYDGRFGYIISGHDSQSDGVPKFYRHSCNIDTKCYKTGILTGQVVSQGSLKDLISIKRELPTGLACRLPLGGYAANKALYSGSPCPI